MMLNEDICSELEAVEAIYGEDVRIVENSDGGVEITLVASPRTALDKTKSYVEATLVISICEGYPSKPPRLSTVGHRGLGDRSIRYFKDMLDQEIEVLQGDPLLCQICEVAFETLTSLNKPEGKCSICLETLVDEQPINHDDFVRLGCYHIFHRDCFWTWWDVRQNTLVCQEQEMQNKAGHRAALRMLKLPRKFGDQFELECPVCRSTIHPPDLHCVMRSTMGHSLWQQNSGKHEEALQEILPSSLYLELRRQQEAWNEKLTSQKKCGGTVNRTTVALTLPVPSQATVSTLPEPSEILNDLAPTEHLVFEQGTNMDSALGTTQITGCKKELEFVAGNSLTSEQSPSSMCEDVQRDCFRGETLVGGDSPSHLQGISRSAHGDQLSNLSGETKDCLDKEHLLHGTSTRKNSFRVNSDKVSYGNRNRTGARLGEQTEMKQQQIGHKIHTQQGSKNLTRDNIRRGQGRQFWGGRGRGRGGRQQENKLAHRQNGHPSVTSDKVHIPCQGTPSFVDEQSAQR